MEDLPLSIDTLSFLALGDSYTIGERVDSTRRWPVQLAHRLREEGFYISDPLVIARTGWTTDELAVGIGAAGLTGPFDLVSLLIGVNNQYRGWDVGEYRVQLRALLGQAVAVAGGRPERVLVLSIPDWGVMPFAADRDGGSVARQIDSFNRVKEEETAALGIRFVDVTGISRDASGDPNLVAEDGLHPSGLQNMPSGWMRPFLRPKSYSRGDAMSNWDERYSQVGWTFGTEANDFLKQQAYRIPQGQVLCLGEGEGRNSVFLAELGYEVVGVDRSQVGLDKALALAQERGVFVETVVSLPSKTSIWRRGSGRASSPSSSTFLESCARESTDPWCRGWLLEGF